MLSNTTNLNQDLNIKINNVSLTKVNKINFLGVILDEKLTWKPQLTQLCVRVSQITGVMYRIRDSLTNDSLRLIYNSTVYPLLLYCSAVWGGSLKTHIDALFLAQKKIIRAISYKSRYEHTNPLFGQLHLLKLHDIILLQTCLFVFKSIHVYPVDILEPLTHNINTRRPHDLRTPYCRTVHAQRCVAVRGVRHRNNLSNNTLLLITH